MKICIKHIIPFSVLLAMCSTGLADPVLQKNEMILAVCMDSKPQPASFFVTRHSVTPGQPFETRDNEFLPITARSTSRYFFTEFYVYSGRHKSQQVYQDLTQWGYDTGGFPNEMNFAIEGTLRFSPSEGQNLECKNIALAQGSKGLANVWYVFSHNGNNSYWRTANLLCTNQDGMSKKYKIYPCDRCVQNNVSVFRIRCKEGW